MTIAVINEATMCASYPSRTAAAINEARRAVYALFDATKPYLDDPIPREVIIPPYEAALEALRDALFEATTAKASGCVLP